MPDTSVKDQIKKLVELQRIDEEIYDIKRQIKEKPQAIEELKEQFETKKAKLNELEGRLKSIQVARKDKELELQQKEQQIAKYNAELNNLKTNKEYSAKITEIEGAKADKARIEERILESYEAGDQITKEIEAEKELVAKDEKVFLEEKKKVEDEVKVFEDRIKVLEGQRKQIVPGIDRPFIDQYERILHKWQGLAIVPVRGNSCGGCHMNVTQQMLNALRMNSEIVSCEMCLRMLYLEEDSA